MRTGYRNGVIPRSPIVRLLEKLSLDEATGCQTYTGAKSAKGYGYVAVGGHRNRAAHRVAYEAARGPIPDGMTLDHLCRNKACCNPDHLEVVPRAENTRRKADPNACPHGHPATAENTSYSRQGWRRCRECHRLRDRARRARLRDEPENPLLQATGGENGR